MCVGLGTNVCVGDIVCKVQGICTLFGNCSVVSAVLFYLVYLHCVFASVPLIIYIILI